MADTPATKKDLDALSKKVDTLQKQVDGLQKWGETLATTMGKNFDQVTKDLKATQDWAKGELDKLAKAVDSK
jgi:hypothetical protein